MALKEDAIEAGKKALEIFRAKAGAAWDSLTEIQKSDISACLLALGEDGLLLLSGDTEAKARISVNVNTLNGYKLKTGIVASRLAVESLKEVLEVVLKVVMAVALAALPK